MCSSCMGGGSASPGTPIFQSQSIQSCIYTVEMLEVWKTKLQCVKTNEYYSQINSSVQEVNLALGVVISALNNPPTLCYFAGHLNSISSLIIKIINEGICV